MDSPERVVSSREAMNGVDSGPHPSIFIQPTGSRAGNYSISLESLDAKKNLLRAVPTMG